MKDGKWDEFYVVLALIVHWIVLFPNIDNFVDHLAVEIFLAGHPVSFLLADIYHTLHTLHEKKGETFLCCVTLLHSWIMTRMPKE